MSESTETTPGTAPSEGASSHAHGRPSLLGRFASQFSECPVPFEVILPDGEVHCFGREKPAFSIKLNNKRGVRAIAKAASAMPT